MLHPGSGANYWIKLRLGRRAEFRDHLWTPEAGEHMHVLDFRFGVVFRFH
ncbi:MAG TPA: hypothetical protein VFD30_23130 [Terriglobia bacterium]|nr:hypothetical protein [Terriglobia bacterium]